MCTSHTTTLTNEQQVLRLANDFYTKCESSPNPTQFLAVSKEDLLPHIAPITNKFLRELLGFGIGMCPLNAFTVVLCVCASSLLPALSVSFVCRSKFCFISAIYHESLTETEKSIVERLFEAGAIQLLISTRGMCWG